MAEETKSENAAQDATSRKAKVDRRQGHEKRRSEAEGKADQVEADLKQAGEKVKDAFKE